MNPTIQSQVPYVWPLASEALKSNKEGSQIRLPSLRSVFPPIINRAAFRDLRPGQTISVFGDQVTLPAIPIIAVLNLGQGQADVSIRATRMRRWQSSIPSVQLEPVVERTPQSLGNFPMRGFDAFRG